MFHKDFFSLGTEKFRSIYIAKYLVFTLKRPDYLLWY
jgi:hypothetical protein